MTLEQLQLLKTQLDAPEYSELSAAAALQLLQTANVPNPTPRGQVSQVLSKGEVMQLLTAQSQARVLTYINLQLVFDSFDLQDHEGAARWCYSLEIVGAISSDERAACVGYIMGTVPDPNYQPFLSWLEIHGLTASETDIAAARLYDRAQALQATVTAARDALSVLEFKLAQLRNGIDPDEVQ